MSRIPTAPLVLGLAGLLPFLWGVATLFSPALADWGTWHLGTRFVGPHVQLFYGAIILSFMGGAIWGFATRADHAGAYVLAVLPALWAFFFTSGGVVAPALFLAAGFAGLLAIDALFWSRGLAPGWWMPLRVLLTSVVVVCLGITAFA